MAKRTLYIFSLGALLFSYQNCSQMTSQAGEGSSSFNSSSAAACANILAVTYQQTYYPTLLTSCGGCHDQGGTGTGAFADPNFSTAFSVFQSMGRSVVENMLLSPTHQPGITGTTADSALISNNAATWTAATQQYASCMVAAGASLTTQTADVGNPALATSSAAVKLSWDLSTSSNGSSTYPLTVTMQVQAAVQPGTSNVVGYYFINPSVKLQAGATSTYELKGMHIYLNDAILTQMTTYESLDAIASSTTSTVMETGTALYAGSVPQASDVFALAFDSITAASSSAPTSGSSGGSSSSTLPTAVEYSDLMSNNVTLGIFLSNCVSCHNAANAQSGLDLTSYSQASAMAQLIHVRMNNTGNPMPPSGVLSTTDRAIVDIWINSGTPQ